VDGLQIHYSEGEPEMDDQLLIKRRFLAWRQPGEDEEGRVELVPATNVREPDLFSRRTAEEVTIRAGSLLSYVTTEDDPMKPPT
jgi:hypothetical protein